MSYNRDMPTGNCQKCVNTFGTLGCCDTISNEWRYNCDDGMRKYSEHKPMTNSDRIRAMSDEELADFMRPLDSGCPRWKENPLPCSDWDNCGECWLKWLKEEVSE